MEEISPSGVDALMAVGASLAHAKMINGVPFVVVPDDYSVHSLESHLDAPVRAVGRRDLRDPKSFIAYVKDLKTTATRLYYTVTPPVFTAVFNDHINQGAPGWCDLNAVYSCPLSPEWKTWVASNGKRFSQGDMAMFIEQNLPDIRERSSRSFRSMCAFRV